MDITSEERNLLTDAYHTLESGSISAPHFLENLCNRLPTGELRDELVTNLPSYYAMQLNAFGSRMIVAYYLK
jgi:hypothetical protein